MFSIPPNLKAFEGQFKFFFKLKHLKQSESAAHLRVIDFSEELDLANHLKLCYRKAFAKCHLGPSKKKLKSFSANCRISILLPVGASI